MCYQKKSLFSLLVCIVLLLGSATCVAETTRIAIFPFEIHAAENLEFMQDGIFKMLSNRLGSDTGNISVVPRTQILARMASAPSDSLEKKFALAQSVGADYFVVGSLTALGSHISTDARFFDTREKAPLVGFSETGTQHGDVILHIDRFAARVNQKIFQQTGETSGQLTMPQDVHTPMVADTPSLKIAPKDDADTAPSGSGLVIVEEAGERDDHRQSSPFQTHLKGVSVGDIDGDGANEMVFIDKNRIYVYRFENSRFVKITEFQKDRHNHFLSVDVADINGNGKAEIFITNNAKLSERPRSFILEHTEDGFILLAEDTKWYYRVLSESAKGPTLLGQQQLAGATSLDSVQVLAFQNGKYVSIDSLTPPKNLTLYEMAVVSNLQEGGQLFVGYVRNHEIAALSAGGETLWRSGEAFDGSLNYFETTNRQSIGKERHYIPQRILPADTDNDGNQEVIVVKNINSSPAFLTKNKKYKRGTISCLEWDDAYALQTKWKTIEEQGYISDVALADATNDGKADLVFSVVSDVKANIKKSSSYLVIQQLP